LGHDTRLDYFFPAFNKISWNNPLIGILEEKEEDDEGSFKFMVKDGSVTDAD